MGLAKQMALPHVVHRVGVVECSDQAAEEDRARRLKLRDRHIRNYG